ncbi:prephenate dehydratase domain-containing protein [Streptomyces sp. NPDC048521]|uniref:prephenate dehydratase domain-containing protein n=1 Tax=Streptomyces sp. NPDC048521 TaxID=3365566 RepID=UPI0037245114
MHTLGPSGTNCEAAARHWLDSHHPGRGEVVLHATFEDAAAAVLDRPAHSVLLGCVAYPELHVIVYQNLRQLTMRECFMLPTHALVLGAPARGRIRTVLTHAAPARLLDGLDVRVEMASSTAAAAEACARGESDACITTRPSAEAHGLVILEDFGPVDMGYSIHVPRASEVPERRGARR